MHLIYWAGDVAPVAEKDLGLKQYERTRPRVEVSSYGPPSKARCASFDGFSGLLDRDADGNRAIGVDDRELFSIFSALEIDRFVWCAVF